MSSEKSGAIEIAGLVIEALVPLTIAIVGWLLHRRVAAIEANAQNLNEVRKQRVAAFSEMAPSLNDILAFATCVGQWQSIDPDQNLSLKRTVDRVFHTNQFLWPEAIVLSYKKFMETCFVTNLGRGTQAKSKANVERHRSRSDWKDGWVERFVQAECRSNRQSITEAYEKLQRAMAASIGVSTAEAKH